MYKVIVSIILLLFIMNNGLYCTAARPSNRINRIQGSVLRNLTRTHSYDDNIVTSHLDASLRIRKFYRMIRDVYNK